jgi:hypothetical protein
VEVGTSGWQVGLAFAVIIQRKRHLVASRVIHTLGNQEFSMPAVPLVSHFRAEGDKRNSFVLLRAVIHNPIKTDLHNCAKLTS